MSDLVQRITDRLLKLEFKYNRQQTFAWMTRHLNETEREAIKQQVFAEMRKAKAQEVQDEPRKR